MFGKIKEKILKASYIKVYGDRAQILFEENNVEVIIDNKKIVHDYETGRKISETVFTADKVIVISFDENEEIISEEVFVDDKKVREISINNDNNTIIKDTASNIDKITSKYEREGEVVSEVVYKSKDREGNLIEIIEVSGEDYISKSIIKKDSEGNILEDVKSKYNNDNNLLLYSENGTTVELEYSSKNRLSRFELSIETPVYEEIDAKGKSKTKSNSKEQERKIIGTKIKTELVKFNSDGKIVYVERAKEHIVKEYYESGELYRQYIIIDSENGKELVGKIIMEDGTVKTINNSTLDNEDIIKKNDEMFNIDKDYKKFNLEAIDYEIINDEIRLNRQIFNIDNEFMRDGRRYEELENGVLYFVVEKFSNGKVSYLEKTNKISGTKLIFEGVAKFIIGMDGVKKEITEEEYQVYKIADELNKIQE